MVNDIAKIIEQIITNYNNELPLSVIESLSTIVRLKGEIYPVRYATHFKPFIDVRDNVFYKVSYSNENIIKIESILIKDIPDNQGEIFLERVEKLQVFNWSWLDNYSIDDEYEFNPHDYFNHKKKKLEVDPLNHTLTLVLTLI